MKKFVYKFLAVAVSFVTAIAMIPLGSESVAYAETSQVTNNVKYFSTTMYNYDKTKINQAAGTIDPTNNFYFINENGDNGWAQNGTINYCYKTSTGWGNNKKEAYNVLVQGIVKNELDSNGQIQFNYKNAGVFAPANTTVAGRTVYQNVQFPFVYDSSTGYYTFDSKKNHVHLDKTEGDNQTLPLYDGTQTVNKQVSFFPFNGDNDNKIDYHFGMNMSVPFYMNANGTNSKGDPMVFEFSGDDDVWVFINGKLALDLGGIHGAIGAKINFKTGDITYSFDENDNANYVAARQASNINNQTTLKTSNLYDALGITQADLAKGENNLQIFYLERGAGASNCKIKFNMQQRDTLEVSKTLGADTPYTKNGFEFQLLKKDSNGTYKPVTNTNYAIYNGSSLISNTTKTDENGKFTLEAGQHANFSASGIAGSEYKVVELTSGYTTTWTGMKGNTTNGSTVSGENAYIIPITQNTEGGVTKYTVNCVNTAGVVLNDDTIVLDYGKQVKYNVRSNDNDSSKNATVYGIGKGSLAEDSTSADGYTRLDKDVALDNGNIQINEDGVVTYTPTRYMNSVDKANYAVQYQVTSDNANNIATTTKYAYASVNVLPATSVYYEDDFGSNDNTDANVAIVWTGTWNQEGTSQNETQSDKNSQYGWDDSYKDDIGFSNGSAHSTFDTTATAKFRFKGTGVDVYSRTNSGVGKIMGTIKKVVKNSDGTESLQSVKTKLIDNLSVSGNYYQIPTLNFDDLEYGTYEVTIKVGSVKSSDGSVRGTYYLDGIRVYNPLGNVDANSTAGKAYAEAGESNAQYIQVRKDLIDNTKVQSIETSIPGSVFIDKLSDKVGANTSDIGTYKEYGPKNEVYLKNNQGVAFKINGYNSNNNKVFIGLKSPTGTSVTVRVTDGSSTKDITLSAASDLYYEVTPDSSGNVLIKNTTDNLLSITKVRITTTNSISSGAKQFTLTSTPELMSYVDKFDTLSAQQDPTQKDTLDKGDVDIDNPSDNNQDNNNEDKNNEQTQSSNIWNKIMNSLKGWFRR